jgi:hypothetical protein
MGQADNSTAAKEWPNVKTFVVSNVTSPQIEGSALYILLQ